MAIAAVPLAESAARAGSRAATALIAAVAALIVAAAALVPFVGYPLALVALFLALRTRRRGASAIRDCGSCADATRGTRRRPAFARASWGTAPSASW